MKHLIMALAFVFTGTAFGSDAGALQLGPCERKDISPPAKCGTYTVWENRDAKAGRTIDLNIVLLQATGRERRPDPLVIFLGGPGQAATSIAAEMNKDEVRLTRDILLIDQRGTGRSNGLECKPDKNGPLQAFMPTLNVSVIKACRAGLEQRADLRYYLTPYAMDDLDDLRAALGYEQINLDGGSYGTRAALVYIRQHGKHVRSATLMASTALTHPMPARFATDSEGALRNVLRDCAAEPPCKAAFPALEDDYRRTVRRIEEGPVRMQIRDPRNGASVEVSFSATDFAESLRAMLYKPDSMRRIPLLLHQAASSGNYRAFADYQIERNVWLADEIADGLYFSITCTEDVARVDPKAVYAAGRGTFLADHRARPHIEGCEGWPVGRLPAAFGEEVQSDVPVLIVNGENDPATPPATGYTAASRLTNARVIIVPGGGHTFAGLKGAECVKGIAARFLQTTDPKSLDVACVGDIRRQPFVVKSDAGG